MQTKFTITTRFPMSPSEQVTFDKITGLVGVQEGAKMRRYSGNLPQATLLTVLADIPQQWDAAVTIDDDPQPTKTVAVMSNGRCFIQVAQRQ